MKLYYKYIFIGTILQGFCWSTWTFIGARFFTGFMGGSATVGFAYISDCIPPERRPKYQSAMSGMTCIAYCLGPVFGTMLVDVSVKLPFFLGGTLASIISIFSFCYVLDAKDLKALEKQNNQEIELATKSTSLNNRQNHSANTVKSEELDYMEEEEDDLEKKELITTVELPSTKEDLHTPRMTDDELDQRESRLSQLITQHLGNTFAVIESNQVEEEKKRKKHFGKKKGYSSPGETDNLLELQEQQEAMINNNNNNIKSSKPTTPRDNKNKFIVSNFYKIFIPLWFVSVLNGYHINSFDVLYPLILRDVYQVKTSYTGFLYTLCAGIFAIVQIYLFDYIRRCFSIMQLYYIGVIFMISSWILQAFTNNVWVTVFAGAWHSFGGAPPQALQTIITSLLCKPEFGGVYIGYIMAADGLARIICPLSLPTIYDLGKSVPFHTTNIIGAIELILIMYMHYQTRNIQLFKRVRKEKTNENS